MGVRVVTDSGCDLPDELGDELGVEIVPLTIRFGTEEFVDRRELSTAEFWKRLRSSSTLPETSAPSAGEFETTFRRLAEQGADGVVCINLSSKLSGTMQAAQVAASALADTCPVQVIDSATLSMGLGNLVISAARMAAAGADLQSIVELVLDQRGRTRVYGALDTLEYLRKGGRIGGAQAFFGSVLSIKPIIEVRNGLVEPAARVRTHRKALQWLLEKLKEARVERLAVLNAEAPDIDEFLALIDPIYPRDELVVGVVGPVIGTHSGPGCIGLTWHDARS